jgi:formylglycine-generating enzyme required for sulfatase activity
MKKGVSYFYNNIYEKPVCWMASIIADSVTNSLCMTFIRIKAGTFTMGSPSDEHIEREDREGPQHLVTISKDFYMQTTEVTQKQWKDVMGDNPSFFSNCGDTCPVEQVSWGDVQSFITKMNNRGEGFYRLPTEAEWEYCARAGTQTAFHWGDCMSSDQANYNGNHERSGCSKGENRQKTIPVANLEKNAWGLFDMHGNVWEWCQDWFENYPSSSIIDPKGPTTGHSRIFRGGGFGEHAGCCRSAYRGHNTPDNRIHILGFRLVKMLE